jgi:hypothetical protein
MKQKEYSMARAVQQLLLHCSVVAVIAPAFGTAILFLLAPPTLDGSSASEVPSLLRLPMGFLFGLILLPFSLHWIIPFTIVTYFGCRYLQYLEPARPVWLVLGVLTGVIVGCFAVLHYSLPISLVCGGVLGGIVGIIVGFAWRWIWRGAERQGGCDESRARPRVLSG